jgi:ADP-heptose:LPS heptosyltransferase/predicted SAM-dependent methyltransferase
MVWRAEDPCGDETAKIRWELPQYTRGRGLDLGCGPSKAFPHFIGVDNYTDTQLFGIQMKPDVVCNVTKLDVFGSASMDFVYSSHCLEHVQDYKGALKEWWRVIRPGGHLCLYLPHKEHYPNIGTEGSNPDHKHDFMPADIVDAMREVGAWDLVRNEDRSEEREYSFFQVYRKRTDGKHLYSYTTPKPEKRAAVVRYGAFGDLIQASSILPALKEQGFHITFYTTPRGWEVVKHDPHVDAVYLQDTDQVPNGEPLNLFWANEAKKYDRWINLSESVEGTLLTLPGRSADAWPDSVRRKHLGINYFEFTHDLAQVPMPPKSKFYPTDDEKAWAKKEKASFGGGFTVLFALAGSSVHKVWPHMDGFIARVLLWNKEARVVLVGDELSTLLESGWEHETRVIRKSGKYSIRETLALLDVVDMVVGPETGVLNAAGHLPVPKIVFMSHSGSDQLTKHWTNVKALTPKNTACYPCHRMHYTFERCNRDDATGTAKCQADISLDEAWTAFKELT